jgi:hypothetical protein
MFWSLLVLFATLFYILFIMKKPASISFSSLLSWIEAGHLSVLLDGSLESRRVGANNGSNLLSILKQHESGHGANVELLSDLGDLVDVNLVETGIGILVREPF